MTNSAPLAKMRKSTAVAGAHPDKLQVLGIDIQRLSPTTEVCQIAPGSRYQSGVYWIFAALVLLPLIVFLWDTGAEFFSAASHRESEYIPLVPLISLSVLYLERRSILSGPPSGRWTEFKLSGLSLAVLIGVIFAADLFFSHSTTLAFKVIGLVIFWIVAFSFCFGFQATVKARFSLLLLFLTVPLPELLLSKIVHFLQWNSAASAYACFQLFGIPVFRYGTIFALPELSIEVAQDCSGIHSAMVLLIASLVLGHWILRSHFSKAVLITSVIPIVVVKNGLRIFTLAVLSIYVDRRFLGGPLHYYGGIPFFCLSLAVLLAVLVLLSRAERHRSLDGSIASIRVQTSGLLPWCCGHLGKKGGS